MYVVFDWKSARIDKQKYWSVDINENVPYFSRWRIMRIKKNSNSGVDTAIFRLTTYFTQTNVHTIRRVYASVTLFSTQFICACVRPIEIRDLYSVLPTYWWLLNELEFWQIMNTWYTLNEIPFEYFNPFHHKVKTDCTLVIQSHSIFNDCTFKLVGVFVCTRNWLILIIFFAYSLVYSISTDYEIGNSLELQQVLSYLPWTHQVNLFLKRNDLFKRNIWK